MDNLEILPGPSDSPEKDVQDPGTAFETVEAAPLAENEPSTESNVQSEEAKINEDDVVLRSFSLINIKHSGGWRTHQEIVNMFARCETSIKLDKPNRIKKCNSGVINFTFESISEARDAYSQAVRWRVDGALVEIHAHPRFFEPVACSSQKFFNIASDKDVADRTIFALHLTLSTDQQLIESIFGSDFIEKLTFLPLTATSQQAEVIFCSKDQAQASRIDGDNFDLDDGEQQSVMKLCTTSEYEEFVKQEVTPKAFNPPSSTELEPSTPTPSKKSFVEPNNTPVPVVQAAPVVEVEDVTERFIQYVADNRVNWAELTEKDELYGMCDAISSEYNGLPDSILKPALLATLQKSLSECQTHWMREHLELLIAQWKQEVTSESLFQRDTMVQMETVAYQPVAEKKNSKRSRNTKALRVRMGVGAMLEAARNKLQTESGEIDVDEDESGNVMIGGEALSFESWAKFNRTNQPEVVRAKNIPGEGNKTNGAGGKQEHEFRTLKRTQKGWKDKMNGAKKMKMMQQDRAEMAALEQAEKEAKEKAAMEEAAAAASKENAVVKPVKELDEGEIDSEEERAEKKNQKKKKKKKASSDSSSSSSSSSSSEDDDADDARKRRRNRRKQERRKGPRVTLPPIFQTMYDNRVAIIRALSIEHQTAFAATLHQMKRGSGGINIAQQERQMMDLMNNLVGSSGGR